MTDQPHGPKAPALLPGQPQDGAGPVFREAWEAQAFAMVLSLHERQAFTWSEWAQTLAAAIAEAQANGDPDMGTTYYHHWLVALERIVIARGLATTTALRATADAWQDAARATPHGQPIVLGAGPHRHDHGDHDDGHGHDDHGHHHHDH